MLRTLIRIWTIWTSGLETNTGRAPKTRPDRGDMVSLGRGQTVHEPKKKPSQQAVVPPWRGFGVQVVYRDGLKNKTPPEASQRVSEIEAGVGRVALKTGQVTGQVAGQVTGRWRARDRELGGASLW